MHNKSARIVVVVGSLALGLAACAGGEVVEPTIGVPHGLTIGTHDATTLTGSFRDDDTIIRFSATQNGERAELTFDVGDKSFGYQALAVSDAHEGWYVITADQVIEAAEIAAAQALLDQLLPYLGYETTAMGLGEASVPKMAYFLSQQPAGAFVASFQRRDVMFGEPASRSLNDDYNTCVRKTTTVTASYDNRNGVVTNTGVVVGSDWGTSACGSGNYSCMGRCGAGCSGFGGGWTLDCLEHDACSHNLCASGGGSSPDCGDEYNHASSDLFSSCSGN